MYDRLFLARQSEGRASGEDVVHQSKPGIINGSVRELTFSASGFHHLKF